MQRMKNAAGRAATTATTRSNGTYHFRHHPSSPCPRNPLSAVDRSASEALGWLAVYLMARRLPPQERRVGWALAERWLGELVEVKHFGAGGA